MTYSREEQEGIRQKIIELDRMLFGALLAINLVCLGGMISAVADDQIKYAATAFAISIPALSMSVFGQSLSAIYGFALKDNLKMVASLVGAVVSVVGVASCFWHFSTTAALVFLACAAACFIIVFRYHIHLGIAFEQGIDKEA